MALAYYMDVHVPRAVVNGLRSRGIDVRTAQQDNAEEESDINLLKRAISDNRILFTHDRDFLTIASEYQKLGVNFPGIVFGNETDCSIGQMVHDLELIAGVSSPDDLTNRVQYIPL